MQKSLKLILKVGLENDFTFQQDNDLKHTAIYLICQGFKDTAVRGLSPSLDSSHIENLWLFKR